VEDAGEPLLRADEMRLENGSQPSSGCRAQRNASRPAPVWCLVTATWLPRSTSRRSRTPAANYARLLLE
jgi:hypothetical protein